MGYQSIHKFVRIPPKSSHENSWNCHRRIAVTLIDEAPCGGLLLWVFRERERARERKSKGLREREKIEKNGKEEEIVKKKKEEIFERILHIIKVAALETVRRFSEVRCPSLWKVVQAFQIFCYPPFKWLQRWGPLRIIVRGAQITITGDGSYIEFCTGSGSVASSGMIGCYMSIAKPVLLLSIATTFSDSLVIGSQSEESSKDVTPESFKKDIPEDWQLQVYGELENKEFLYLKDVGSAYLSRFNVDELNRFYAAANGDLANLLSSLKKSIRWRESYNILSSHELEVWSHLVFWHGFDVMLRPCLVIRLGLAWSTLAPDERPRFAQAIGSEADHSQKLQIVGERNRKLLSDFLESVPAFLGGDCSCPKCRILSARRSQASTEEICRGEPSGNTTSDASLAASNDFQATELTFSGSCEHVLRAAVVLILMLWVLIAFFAVTNE
ncbi:hypothetical protein HPP92_019341 [Vanilla planifolia]|uniref:Uncharacterized protein n=1 Tax=Vanilla planifolia TaxID=51239 RepID=A0A835QCA6_VANPL|nr:hypothetical protein HPP92_019341 [Vanilla planifolia]